MGEQTVDKIVSALNRSARNLQPCRTAKEPLLPATETAGVSGIVPPDFSRRAVEHYLAREWAVHLDDVMVRRTSWHWYYRDSAAKAQKVADWMAELLGWSDATRQAELDRYFQMTGGKKEASAPSPRQAVSA